jgi:predicted transcriptional regulator
MRTTVTLDPDVAAKLKRLAHRRQSSFKSTLNEVLRRGLAAQERSASMAPFVVESHAGGFRPGIDPGKLNQLIDQLEAEDFAREARTKR